jgi:hypothetical protein
MIPTKYWFPEVSMWDGLRQTRASGGNTTSYIGDIATGATLQDGTNTYVGACPELAEGASAWSPRRMAAPIRPTT